MTAATKNSAFLKAFPLFSPETVTDVSRRGLLSVLDRGLWRFGDSNNGSTRRLDDRQKFVRCDNEGVEWHKLIGLCDVIERDRRNVIFVLEGSKDALAAFEFLRRAGLLSPDVGVVTALGAGYRPITAELLQLVGRKVFLIGDRDQAGMESVQRVSDALTGHGINHVALNWNSFPHFDGKDLFDLLKSDNGKNPSLYKKFFLFFSPSNGSTVQRFNGSTHSPSSLPSGGFNSSTHIQELVSLFVLKKRGTGNAFSFALARALREHETTSNTLMDTSMIDEVFHDWFTKSQPLLPPDADEQKSLVHFYKQMRRVRYPTGALDAALERAAAAPLPDLPGMSDTVRKVAALVRELQRDAGEKSFIAPVNVVAKFANLDHPEKAKRILFILEKAGVIQCVDRGAPHMPGKPGKSTIWRAQPPC